MVWSEGVRGEQMKMKKKTNNSRYKPIVVVKYKAID